MVRDFSLGNCAKTAGLVLLNVLPFESTDLVTPFFLFLPSILLLKEVKLLIVFNLWQVSCLGSYQKLIEIVCMLEFDITCRE